MLILPFPFLCRATKCLPAFQRAMHSCIFSGVLSTDGVKVLKETVWRHPQMVNRITVIGLALDILTNEQNRVLCDKLGSILRIIFEIRTPACTPV
jgi:hypothetical protein